MADLRVNKEVKGLIEMLSNGKELTLFFHGVKQDLRPIGGKLET